MPRIDYILARAGTAAQWAALTSPDNLLPVGELAYETDTHKLKIGDGVTVWSSLPYIGTGSTVADADATTKGIAKLYPSTSLGTNTDGAPDQNAVKVYVDAAILSALEGLKWKASVKVATTANGTLATAYENGDTVDGVTLATGDRILIKNQTTQSENGIYIVNASGAPTRASDANSAAELEGAAVTVQQGTSNANTTWTQTTDGITLGSSSIVWAQFGSSVPDADATTKGIGKLYAGTGSNTDGSMTQNAITTALSGKEDAANKDTANGYPGLSSWAIKFRNLANTFTSLLQNAATAIRTYTFPDKSGTVALLDDFIGAQDMYVPATAMWPRITGGCQAIEQAEIATSIVNIQTLNFDQTTQEFAQFTITLPRNWDRGTVTARLQWTAASGTGGVVWGIKAGAYSDGDSLTTALGTEVTVSDTFLSANQVHTTAVSSAITVAGSPADADFLAFQISRNPSDGSDNLTADAKLLGVFITLTIDNGVAS